MHAPKWVALWAGFVFSGLVLSQPARAIIVMGDQGRNLASTSPVPDGLDRYVGSFGGFLGTPIGPRYFVTAAHIGNQGPFRYKNGTSTETVYNDLTQVGTLDDLAIFQINTGPDFSLVAPLYTGSNEVGLPLVTLGRGTAARRGGPAPGFPIGAASRLGLGGRRRPALLGDQHGRSGHAVHQHRRSPVLRFQCRGGTERGDLLVRRLRRRGLRAGPGRWSLEAGGDQLRGGWVVRL